MTVSVFITDDHALVLEGMKELLRAHKEVIRVIGDAANGKEAVEAVLQLRPDVVLMDLEMPVMGGVEAIEMIKKEVPDAEVIVTPDIEAVCYGRKVGYEIKEIKLDENLEKISATEIRKKEKK
jgi:two-component system nitrate/nitrite response regulator NarL